jgi:histone H3/H4
MARAKGVPQRGSSILKGDAKQKKLEKQTIQKKRWHTSAEMAIHKAQRETGLVLKRAPVRRLVREVLRDEAAKWAGSDVQMTAKALDALQEALEAHLVTLMMKAHTVAKKRRSARR